MGALGVTLGIFHYLGLYLQLGAPARAPAANALFTETPHDMTAHAGEDVEMACSFRGSGSPSYSLEIQWWYVRNHRDWTDKQTWASNQLKASQREEAGKEATKISLGGECWGFHHLGTEQLWAEGSHRAQRPCPAALGRLEVVKVVGSNISHKLRLSRVKPTDEGTYECRVIDFSDSKARHHKVKAYLRVEPEESSEAHRHSSSAGHVQDTQLLGSQLSDHARLSGTPSHPQHHPHKMGKELRKRAADTSCLL
ncbi:unnamed protein product [Lepidochelys olivacea]